MIPSTWSYRHDEITTCRPYGVDVDQDDWLWEGCGKDRLVGHNLRTAALRSIALPLMGGHVAYDTFAWNGRLVLTLGTHVPYYAVVDPEHETCVRRTIPGVNPVVWYGAHTPNGKVVLFERSESKVLLLDDPLAEPRVIHCPFPGELAAGGACSDGLIYSAMSDPLRMIRFDPLRERFVDEIKAPFADSTVSGRFEHKGILYAADSAKGRLLPFDLAAGRWLDPIPAPDHGSLYGFIGVGFGCGCRGYYCLSTYTARSRLDTRTGRIIVPDGRITVDGRPPRFMDRMLVFDAEEGKFDYLRVPEQPDGIPLLCYSWSDGKRFAVTGIVIPFAEPGVPGKDIGPWLVMQSEEADREPGFIPGETVWDREAHIGAYRRGYALNRSLFLPHEPWTPPIVNLRGPATQYPPGREAELTRRAARTDPAAYWKGWADQLLAGIETDDAKVKTVCRFVNHAVFYNPIQAPDGVLPLAALQAHDARCGAATRITCDLLAAAGVEARPVGLTHHVVAEAFYNGDWHIADALFFGDRPPSRDGRVCSVDELKETPYFADAYPQRCFVYDPELLLSEDGYQVLGYCMGPWGSQPYYSYYLQADKDCPPTLPAILPAQRLAELTVRLRWTEAIKMGGGRVEYDVRVCTDRECQEDVFRTITVETGIRFDVPMPNRMYFIAVRAMDDHRQRNPDTWYPAARGNFVLVPEDQYGWYGVM